MSVIRFDPWREFDALFRTPTGTRAGGWVPAASISESDDAYRIDLDLPAVAREDVEVSVRNRHLRISGKRRSDAPEGFESVRREHPAGEFSRTFVLPKNARVEDIEAKCLNGVLTVVIRKAAEAGPRRIEIEAA